VLKNGVNAKGSTYANYALTSTLGVAALLQLCIKEKLKRNETKHDSILLNQEIVKT